MEKIREVELVKHCGNRKISGGRYIAFALDVMDKLGMYGKITILFCGEDKIRDLNKHFLGKDRPTDVLSFPSGAEESGVVNIGDVAICVRVAEKQSAAAGVKLEEELKKLIVHAFLHLDGYDHDADNGRMERKERSVLKAMGVRI